MSLINQMLKDLEQRGAGSTDAIKTRSTALSASMPQASSFPYIKVALLLTLLTGGVYSWLQTSPKSSLNITDAISRMTSSEPKAPLASENPAQNAVPAMTEPATSIASVAEPLKPFSPAPAVSLFETELKYTPGSYQPPKTQKASAPAETAATRPTGAKQSEEAANNNNEAGKSPARQVSLKASTKLSSDKPANDNPSAGKEIRPDQKSGNYYRLALSNLQQGRVSEALANLTLSLEANPANQEARQTLAGLLLDNKRNDEAKAILSTGLSITPEQSNFRIALARLQVESGDRAAALNTLEQGLAYAKGNADYQGFLATLLQRADRHEEAISHYMSAISLGAATPSTLVGLGISLQAVGKLDNAKESFTRAQTNTALTPELALFVEQRLKQINQRLQHN